MEIRNIPGWTYLLTFGYGLDIYGKGKKRKAVDRKTGQEILNYTLRD